jgi:hypothetical protein
LTTFDFAPSVTAVFTFHPTLDGAVYNASVPFLLFGNRPYLNLQALDGAQVWFGAVAGSPGGVRLQSLAWANGRVSAVAAAHHGYRIATTVELTIAGCVADAYNGRFPCLITGPASFSYPLAAEPGAATVFGAASYDINLIGGVAKPGGGFFSSTLIYRASSRQFEVSP